MKGKILHSTCMPEAQEYPFARCYDKKDPPPYEPNYILRTHGEANFCSQRQIRSFHSRNINYVFYLTQYSGIFSEYKNRYYIYGYFRDISYRYNESKNRYVLYGGDDSKFVSIHNAWEVTEDSWTELFHKFPGFNLQWLGGGRNIGESQINYLLEYFENKPNEISNYIRPY